MSNIYRGPSIDASYQVSGHLAEGFRRRRLKCEKLTRQPTPRPKLKISLFPLTRPTLSKSADRKKIIGNFLSLFFFFFRFARNSFCCSPKNRYFRITKHIFVVKKKKKAYLPTHFQNCGSGKGKQKYF